MTAIVVYKTASNLGDNKAFECFNDYQEYHKTTNGEAHQIIETDRVDELMGCDFEIKVDRWGNTKISVVDLFGIEKEYTIPQFFNKYRY